MGNRDALLEGALQCLVEKGYARTTARDISAASGVSLAAIGYHFGTKDQLLNAALFQATEEWGERVRALLAEDPKAASADPYERFERTWERVLDTFDSERALWVASFELVTQAGRVPAIREAFAGVQEEARRGLANLFTGMPEDDPRAVVVGGLVHAMLSGMLALWVMSPATLPRARELADALRVITTAPPAG